MAEPDGPLFVPVRFDGGANQDTIVVEGESVSVNLTTQFAVSNVEVINLRGSGTNSLFVDANAVYEIDRVNRSLIIDKDDDDIVEMLGTGWREQKAWRLLPGFGNYFDVYEFNDGVNPHLTGVLLYVDTNVKRPAPPRR